MCFKQKKRKHQIAFYGTLRLMTYFFLKKVLLEEAQIVLQFKSLKEKGNHLYLLVQRSLKRISNSNHQ